MKTPTRARKPRTPKRPERSVRVTHRPETEVDTWTIRITVAGEHDDYDVCQGTFAHVPVWFVRKVKPTLAESVATETYVVDLGEFGHSCTCKAGAYRGTCRHVDALVALTGAGKLPRQPDSPAPRRAVACPDCKGEGSVAGRGLYEDHDCCRTCNGGGEVLE